MTWACNKSPLDQRLKFDVTAFANRIDNITALAQGAPLLICPAKAGAEAWKSAPAPNSRRSSAARWRIPSPIPKDSHGDELRRRPRHVASLGLNYRFIERGQLQLTVRHHGSSVDTAFDAQTFETILHRWMAIPWSIWRRIYSLDKHWQFFGGVFENLFDKQYEDVLGYSGTERGVYVGALPVLKRRHG